MVLNLPIRGKLWFIAQFNVYHSHESQLKSTVYIMALINTFTVLLLFFILYTYCIGASTEIVKSRFWKTGRNVVAVQKSQNVPLSWVIRKYLKSLVNNLCVSHSIPALVLCVSTDGVWKLRQTHVKRVKGVDTVKSDQKKGKIKLKVSWYILRMSNLISPCESVTMYLLCITNIKLVVFFPLGFFVGLPTGSLPGWYMAVWRKK